VHRKVRKSEELVVGKGCATGNDSIFRVGNKTMTLFWVEVQAVVSIAQKENRNEVNGGVKNIKPTPTLPPPLPQQQLQTT
jgi:hypothetical protein